MADSGGNSGETDASNQGAMMPFAPFEMWSEWLTKNLGDMSAMPGASVPWMMTPGISTGAEAKSLPQGTMANDPLMSAMQKLSDANPLSSVIPIDWVEISRALQTLWMREMSAPARAMQVATDYNRRFFEASMEV